MVAIRLFPVIPYEDGGSVKPMFPDLLIVRQDAKGDYLFGILALSFLLLAI